MARELYRNSPKVPAHVCKVVLLGKAGCGKTCLLQRFLHNSFNISSPSTVGAAFGTKTILSGKGPVSIQIWDTAGQEQYQALASLYYRNAKAAIICCDLTDKNSYDKLKYWLNQLRDAEKNCKIYICGNKLDLVWDEVKPRQISLKELKYFQAPAFETSSKADYNVSNVFQAIVEDVIADDSEVPIPDSKRSFKIKSSEEISQIDEKRCCHS